MDEFSIAYCSWPVECVVSAVRELPILRTKKCVCFKRTNLDISQSKKQEKVRLFLQPPNHRLRWQSFRLHGIGQSLRSACEWGNPNGGRLLIWGMSCGFVVLCYRGNSHEKNVGAIRVEKAEHFCQQEREKYPCVPYRCFVPAPFELLYLAYECIWPYDCHPLVTEVNGKPRVLIKQDYMSLCASVLQYRNERSTICSSRYISYWNRMFSYLSLLGGYNLTKLEIPEDPCSYPPKRLIIRGTFCGSTMFRCTLMDHRALWCLLVSITLQKGGNLKVQPKVYLEDSLRTLVHFHYEHHPFLELG